MLEKLNTKLVNLMIPICIILAPFAIFQVFYKVGFFILLVYGIFSILFLKNSIRLPKSLFYFFITILSVFLINCIRTEGASLNILNFIIGAILTIFYVSVIPGGFKFPKFYKIYKIISLIVSIVLIIQALRLNLFGIPAVPINLLPVPVADYNYWDYFKGERPSGFFSEPQAFCSFVIPFFIFSLNRKEFLSSTVIFLAILLSTSTLGLAISSLILSYFLIIGKKVNTYTKIGVVLGSILIFFFMLSQGFLDSSIEKIKATPIENNIRLVRGFYVYGKFDFLDKLLGICYSLESYVLQNIKDPWVSLYIKAGLKSHLGYTTSFSGLLIQFGIPGFIMYLFFLKDCYKSGSDDIKILVIVTFLLCFAQTIIFNAWFVFYMSIILGSNYEKGTMKFINFK